MLNTSASPADRYDNLWQLKWPMTHQLSSSVHISSVWGRAATTSTCSFLFATRTRTITNTITMADGRRRVAVGRWWQETNDLNPCPTTRQNFVDFGKILCTLDDFEGLRGSRAGELGAFMDELGGWESGCDIVPLAAMTAFSSGRMAAADYNVMREEILLPLRVGHAAQALDGVIISLHGAMVGEGAEDPEGALLADIRAIVGKDTPIVCTLDLHCHVTREMIDAATALVSPNLCNCACAHCCIVPGVPPSECACVLAVRRRSPTVRRVSCAWQTCNTHKHATCGAGPVLDSATHRHVRDGCAWCPSTAALTG